MFAAEFEPAETNGRRRSPRAPVSFDISIGQGGIGRTLCKVVDISLQGARIQSYSAIRRGSQIWLNLPEIGPVVATVMWADDFQAGCQFQKPLDRQAFARLVGEQPADSPGDKPGDSPDDSEAGRVVRPPASAHPMPVPDQP